MFTSFGLPLPLVDYPCRPHVLTEVTSSLFHYQTAISSCKQDIQLVLDKLDNVQEALTPVKNNQLIDLSHSPSSDKENSTPLKPRPRIKQERLLLSAKRGCPPMTITIPKLEEQVRITAVKNELDSTNTGSPPNHMLALSPSHDSESNISKLTKPAESAVVKSEMITPQELDLFDADKVKQENTDEAAEEEDDVNVKIEAVNDTPSKSPLVQKIDNLIATAKSMNDKYGGKSPKPTSYQQLDAKSPKSPLAVKDEPQLGTKIKDMSEVEPIGEEINDEEHILYQVKTIPYRTPICDQQEEPKDTSSYTHGYRPFMMKGTLKLYRHKTTGKHRLVQRSILTGIVNINIPIEQNVCVIRKTVSPNAKKLASVSFFARDKKGICSFVLKVKNIHAEGLYEHLLACGGTSE